MRRHHPSSSRAGRGGVQSAASRPSGFTGQPLSCQTTRSGPHLPGQLLCFPFNVCNSPKTAVMLFYLLVSNPIMMRLRLLSVTKPALRSGSPQDGVRACASSQSTAAPAGRREDCRDSHTALDQDLHHTPTGHVVSRAIEVMTFSPPALPLFSYILSKFYLPA